MRLSRVLVATDFGGTSDRAVAAASDLAAKLGAKLVVLHVWALPLPAYADGIDFPLETLEAAARDALADVEARLKDRHPDVEMVLAMGVAWERILDTAKAREVDIIVLGTHGRRGVPRWFLGSVAEKVVRSSPVPVLTVGPEGEARAEG